MALGLFELRFKLRLLGIERGFQWIGGSFTEDVETYEQRNPGDIDVVTFIEMPKGVNDDIELAEFFGDNVDLFDRLANKKRFRCDSYIIPLSAGSLAFNAESLVARIAYWGQIFGVHKRTRKAKGFIQLDLDALEEDQLAIGLLETHRDARGGTPA